VLHNETRGAGPRVVLLHGFTQTGRSWAPIAADLATDHEVVAVDLPGHGGSGSVHADLVESARQVAELGGRGSYVGYSLGGRVALQLALDHPDVVERLVLVSTTAGIEDDAQRAARRTADEALADDIERDGVDAFLGRWLAHPLFATLDATLAGLDDRRRNTAEGLAASLRLSGTGTMHPLWDRLGELDLPLLVVSGELDAKFCTIGERLVADIGPNASMTVIQRAGHAVPFEQPDKSVVAMRRFLTRAAG